MSAMVRASNFTEEEITLALLTLAQHGGNSERAAQQLREGGIRITSRTLRNWREAKYVDRYRRLHETHGREIEAALLPELRANAIQGARVAHLAIRKAEEEIEAGKVRDLASAARNLQVASATAMDKLYLATDRPTEIRGNLTPAEILDRLIERLPRADIDGTATEIAAPEIERGD